MKKSILSVRVLVFLAVLAGGCAPAPAPTSTPLPTPLLPTLTASPLPATATPEPTATTTAAPSSPELYMNEAAGFSLERPAAWVVTEYAAHYGLIGTQVFWGVDSFDPMQQPGDRPAVDQVTDVSIAGLPAKRMLGHYLGAIGDMGYQQYLRYVIQKGDVFYSFSLFAVDARGLPAHRMTETLPLREEDVAQFEQMMATLKFNP